MNAMDMKAAQVRSDLPKMGFNLQDIRKIVVELPFGLGDHIMCFPLFASIKKALPGAKICALAPNKNSALVLSGNRNIDSVYEYGLKKFTYREMFAFFRGGFLALRRFFRDENFDLFIVVHPNRFRSLLLKFMPYRHFIANYEQKHKSLEAKNVLDLLCIEPVWDYAMKADDAGVLEKFGLKAKGYVLLDPYAQHLERDPRNWFYFDELIGELTKQGMTVAMAGINPGHTRRADVADLVNATTLPELLSIIKNARLAVTLDSGIFHFSYALGTPAVGLFGPVDPAERVPLNSALKVKALTKKLDCSPCIKNRVDIPCVNTNQYRCMKEISVDDVMKAVDSLL